MVRVYVPTGVLDDVVTVRVDVPDPVTEVGANTAELPEGNPLTEKVAVSVKPFNAPMPTVYGTIPPCTVDCDDGEAEIEKSGAGLTVTFRVGGVGSFKFALSVTVSVAVYEPSEE